MESNNVKTLIKNYNKQTISENAIMKCKFSGVASAINVNQERGHFGANMA